MTTTGLDDRLTPAKQTGQQRPPTQPPTGRKEFIMAKHSTGTEVRAWGQSATLPEGVPAPKQGRGRLDTRVIDAFNAEHPRAKYLPKSKAPAETVEVKFKASEDGKGRTLSKRVNIAQAREFGKSNGYAVGDRGTLSQEVKAAFARSLRG